MVSITHAKPKYSSYQADPQHLKALGLKDWLYLNLDACDVSIPLEKKPIFDTKFFDLVTPINFQETLNLAESDAIDDIYQVLQNTGGVSFYIQTKNQLTTQHPHISSQRFRTNFFFDLTLSTDALLKNMKRDARQRLKKAQHNFATVLSVSTPCESFMQAYQQIAHKNQFSDLYRFTPEQFRRFSETPNILYLELKSQSHFVAGGFFGVNQTEVDYLYGAQNPDFPDSIRLLIWNAVKYFKKLGKQQLFLGGGIAEQDSLAEFKKRQGCFEQPCHSIMGILDIQKAEYFAQQPFDVTWFSTFFPLYQRPNHL